MLDVSKKFQNHMHVTVTIHVPISDIYIGTRDHIINIIYTRVDYEICIIYYIGTIHIQYIYIKFK